MIRVTSLNKYFNKGQKNQIHALNKVTITFDEKGLTVILGTSGSGKTTLLNVMGGLDKVESGTIDFYGQEIEKYDAKVWDQLRNERIGYIFQNYHLLPNLSVYDNIAFVLKMIGINDAEEVKKRVDYVLHAVGIFPFRRKKALQLSGGQMQRVAIARALVKNPDVIIADEPTGNLDSKNTLEIMNIIQEIAKEKLVILVTHEKDIAEFYANRIIRIEDGQIVSDEENIQTENHSFVDEQVIYLKDLQQIEIRESDALNMALYAEDQIKTPLKINLIIKNNTLLIDVDASIKTIKLVNEHKDIQIKDAHYVTKSREEISKTTFDAHFLSHQDVAKTASGVVSIKASVKTALQKILGWGRKGKLMLASFVLAGAIIAFASSMLSAAVVIRPDLSYPENTLRVASTFMGDTLSNTLSYQELLALDPDAKAIMTSSGNLTIDIPQLENQASASFNASLAYAESVTASALSRGRLPDPDNPNEILISKQLAESILNDTTGSFMYSFQLTGNDYGLWTENDILRETYRLSDINDIKVVGIVKAEHGTIYIQESLYLQFLEAQSISSIEDAYNESYQVWIFASNRRELYQVLDEIDNLSVFDLYDSAYDLAKEINRQISAILSPIVFIFLGFTLIGFYFIMRSSLISRILEVSIFRALGVKKKEILRMFSIEILMLTTISTLLGFIIGTIGVLSLQSSLLNVLNVFHTTVLSTIVGLIAIYGFNLLAGLLPVMTLLAKTPSQIITQYDI